MKEELAAEIALHMSEPFPESVVKGCGYGEVDAVMVGADIVGWATQAPLDPLRRRSLRGLADELARSLDAFPPEARSYYERLLRIARKAAAID